MAKVRGNKRLTGTWSEVWFDGQKIAEAQKIEAKISINREDVQVENDMDSKVTSQKGEFTLTVKKVYTRFESYRTAYNRGEDPRFQILTKLADPDAVNKQQERYSIDNCWFNELPVVSYELGALIEQEFTGGFTPSDMINLDQISV